MRLTQLEIKGFKSFANDTVIHFNEDVIGIVGPNGSGKSNIVDAIRWVLGEQKSKELRLEKMTNVIFNGTKNRRAGGMAQVALTFENTKNLLPTEYHTLTISRSLYQSGESEYRLNNVPCRLKDITSLFLDTGIGSNSYAIIALGMVDDILADKENARRKMFEQAAGISKYKIRKKETLQKLQRTEADLDRIEDLLFEIEGNLKTLEKQARRTQKYFEIKQAYKELSISLAIHELASFKKSYQALEKKIAAEKDRQTGLEAEVQKFEAELQATRKANLDKEKALTDRQRDLNQLVSTIRNTENEKNLLAEKKKFAERNQQTLQKQIEESARLIENFQEEIEIFAQDLQYEKKKERRTEDQLDLAEKNLNEVKNKHGNLKSDLSNFLEGQKNLDHIIFDLEKRKAVLQNQEDSAAMELRRLEAERKDRAGTITELEQALQELNQNIRQQESMLQELEQNETNRLQTAEQIEKELETTARKVNAVNRKLDARRHEYQLTLSMIENLEGFPESIKFLNKNKSWGIDPPLLSDLIYSKEDYRVAIENFLDPYLNYYVVPTLTDAQKAISLLSNAQKGKAHFFILDSFKDSLPPSVFLPPGTIPAVEVVTCDPPYQNLVSWLLGNVLIAEQETLPPLFEEQDVTILSKNGQFIRKKHAISGGSVGLFEGKKLGRKMNLQLLQNQIKKAEQDENTLSSEYYRLKTELEKVKANANHQAINDSKKDLNKLEQQKISLMTRLESAENFRRTANEKEQSLLDTKTNVSAEIKTVEEALQQQLILVDASRNEVSRMDASYREAADQLNEATQAFNQLNIALIKQQNKVASIQRELSFREKQLDDHRIKESQNRQSLKLSQLEQESIHTNLAKLEEELLIAYQKKSEKAASLSEAEQGYFQARSAINDLDDKVRHFQKQVQQSRELSTDLKEQFNEVKMKISSIAERVRIEFNVTATELINRRPDDQNPDDMREKVAKIKQKLDNYGEINPLAVEAFEEMKKRFESISKQRNDILEARESLNETIKEIEETATSQFLDSFKKARTYFIDVFRSLFTENDTCDLILLQPDNPLESGIEIIAKPKGKRPQSISQLSGGEKTLTATALLFALYLLKPAPFCIFDEVDAPLDDANIDKFNTIIKKFSADSQFIIVTHNKQTMAAVDVIYGVYMNEPGVSAVAAVDFRTLSEQN